MLKWREMWEKIKNFFTDDDMEETERLLYHLEKLEREREERLERFRRKYKENLCNLD